MPDTWSDRINTVLSACRACAATDAERDHALALLSRWQSPERAVAYAASCRQVRDMAALARQCPYVGEL